MVNGGRTGVMVSLSILCIGWMLPAATRGALLTIPEIQYTESADGASPYNGEVIDCAGGVVVAKTAGSRPRLYLQEPNAPDGWAAITVKGWTSDAFADVNVGDWVELEHVFVEEFRGTTLLQYWDQNPDASLPALRVTSRGNDLPRPLLVDANEIQAPAYLATEDAWVVADHRAEKFESMLLQVRDVDVVEQDLGKARDNYELWSFREPNDATQRCWASDYLNQDRAKSDLYLPGIEVAHRLRAATGLLEQYTNLGEGFDYYQLLTLSQDSVVPLCPADLNQDGDVDLRDYSLFVEQLLLPAGAPQGEVYTAADLNEDGTVDGADLTAFNAAWQQDDANGDGVVDARDLD
jgi:predicted extracellular nuclease